MESLAYSTTAVRKSLVGFLFGKATSALLAFILFALIARLLAVGEYGIYVATIAIMELGIAFSSFGLDWLAVRYVPECRISGSGRQLVSLISRLALLQLAGLTVVAVVVFFSSTVIARMAGLVGESRIIQLYAVILLFEGMARVIRDQFLGGLLLQWRAQLAQITRNLLFILLIIILKYTKNDQFTVFDIARIEVIAVGASFLVSFAFLSFCLLRNRNLNCDKHWTPPDGFEMFKLARNTYLGYLMSLAYGGHMLSLILSSMAGKDMVAVYGFCRNLSEQIRRYLPADLFLGIIRPTLVARYAGEGGFVSLNNGAQIILCISIFLLMPILVCMTAYDNLVVETLGGSKFGSAQNLLPLFMLSLFFISHRRVVEMVACTVSMSSLVVRAGAWLVAMPVLVAFVLSVGMRLEAVVLVSVFGEAVFNVLVYCGLRDAGVPYTVPWGHLAKILLVGLVTFVFLKHTPLPFSGPLHLCLGLVLTVILVTVIAIIIKPFPQNHRDSINRLIGRRLFIF